MKRVIKRIVAVFTALYIIMILLITFPGFLGCYVETVTTGSMEPAIHAGALIYVRKADFEQIEVNDVITYWLRDGKTKVTHRVKGKDRDSESFVTKGDANDKEDAGKVEFSRVEGKVIGSIPVLGTAALLLTNLWGKSILAALLLALFMVYALLSRPGQKQQEGKAGNPQVIQRKGELK